MRRRNVRRLGNALMVTGIIAMSGGVAANIINMLPEYALRPGVAQGAVLLIFLGAIVWLTGAGISSRETIVDRYWWLRHYDQRYRRSDPPPAGKRLSGH